MKKGSTATLRAIQTLLAGEILIEIGAAAIAVVVIGNYSLTAVIIILGFTIGYIMVNRYLGRKLSRQEEIVEKADQELRARVHEALENIEAIRYHHATDREREWNYQLSQTTTNEHIKSAWLESWSNLFARLSNMLPFIVAAVVFIPMLERRVVDVGTFFMLLMYGQRIVSPFHAVSRIWMDLKKDEPRIRALLQILAVQPTVTESPEAREMQPLQRSIIFRDVAFRYPENQEPIINIRHLEILARQTTALIGETGKAGKTTIANLLTRLFDVERGSITFDDTDVRDLSFSSLYRQVYYVAQHPRVFSGTIWDLLTYGLNQQEITREDVIDACRRAKADFVFDRGFAAEVGENAGNLSGGERQRLMLARIFLRRPSVVILDEPTSALDQETERFVIESLDKLRAENPDMTFIVIAHRLRTIEKADYIVCLEHGRVHATGTHQELLETSTVYRQLCGLELPD